MKNENELSGYKTLDGLKKTEPFRAPDDYWESFNSSLRDKLSAERKPGPAFTWKPALLAGSILVAALGIFLVNKPSGEMVPMAEPDYSSLLESGYYYELDEEQVSEAYSAVFELSAPTASEQYLLQQIDEEMITTNL